MAQIRDLTGVKLVSCYSIIRDWRKKGFVISNGKLGVSHRTKVTVELEQQLINTKTLTEMAPHSL
jgi:transposase